MLLSDKKESPIRGITGLGGGIASYIFYGTGAGGNEYEISRSLRFNSPDNSYLNRTPSVAGNRKTFTVAFWIKRTKPVANFSPTTESVFGAAGGSSWFDISFYTIDELQVITNAGVGGTGCRTQAVFRDFSAWMHFVIAVDTTDSTANDRIKIYVNGVRQAVNSPSGMPALNSDTFVNSTTAHYFGRDGRTSSVRYGSSYLADCFLIDGQALDPTAFGEFDEFGVWQPKEFTGSYADTRTVQVGSPSYPSDFTTTGNKTSDQTALSFSTWSGSYTGAVTKIFKMDDTTTFDLQIDLTNGTNDRYLWTSDNAIDWTYVGNISSLGNPYTLSGFRYYATSEGSGSTTLTAINPDAGTNSFHLNFSDNSSSTALGADSSGENNNWSVNNISHVDGTNYTSLLSPITTDDNLFDGSTSTNFIIGSGLTYTITFPTPIPFTTLEGWSNEGVSNAVRVTVNGTNTTDIGGSNWDTLSGSSPLTSLSFTAGPGGSGGVYMNAIRVDGTVLTDGSSSDSLVDSPTNGTQTDTGAGGEVVGNYCTMNPLDGWYKITSSNGNLEVTGTSNQYGWRRGTLGATSGKFYWECQVNGQNAATVGVCEINAPSQVSINDETIADAYRNQVFCYNSGFQVYIDGSLVYTGSTVNNNDIIGVAVDLDNDKVWFSHNGVFQGSGTQNPASNAGGYSPTNLSSGTPYFQDGAGAQLPTGKFNFGQQPFTYTAPSGFKAFCTTNLPTPTIADGSTAFDATLWTGNGTSQTITGLGFSPDFLWVKNRTSATSNYVTDTVRGITKYSITEQSSQEGTNSTRITAVTSDGFSVGTHNGFNDNNKAYVGWTWDAGTSTATNTDGSITSTVRDNPSAGFSVATWTGSGSGSVTVGHGLGDAPYMYIVKDRTNDRNWLVYHNAVGATKGMQLNLVSAQSGTDAGYWNNTAPTSTVASIGTYGNESANYVGYFFAPVDGYSSFGSYTGNGSTDGPFIYTGFRSRFILIKRADLTGDWLIYDTARDEINTSTKRLYPNESLAEASASGHALDILSNGFCIKGGSNANYNASGGTYIYTSFAEHPFRSARAR